MHEVVGRVRPDVTAPHHARPGGAKRLDEPGGLGIVEEDEVVGRDQVEQLGGVPLRRREVGGLVALPRALPVARGTRGACCGSAS